MKNIIPPLNEYPQLERFLALRALGASYGELAEQFHVDKLRVRYICRRFGLAGANKPSIRRGSATSKYTPSPYSEGEINPGKTYQEYLKEDKERQWKNLVKMH